MSNGLTDSDITDPKPVVYDHAAYQQTVLDKHGITSPTTRILPATHVVVPARVSLGKVKITKAFGEEMVEAEVLVDGKRVGQAEDRGHGGGIHFYPDSREGGLLEEQVQAEYWLQQGKPSFFIHETLWNDLVEDYRTLKTLKTKIKNGKRTPVLKGVDSLRVEVGEQGFSWTATEWLEVSASLDAVRGPGREPMLAQGITHVFDGDAWVAL